MSHHKIYVARWVDGKRTTIHSKGDAEPREIMVIGNKYYISGWEANNFNMQNSRAAIWEGTVKTAKLLKPGKDPKLQQATGGHHAASGF